jgi:hypothetical protein
MQQCADVLHQNRAEIALDEGDIWRRRYIERLYSGPRRETGAARDLPTLGIAPVAQNSMKAIRTIMIYPRHGAFSTEPRGN